MSDKLVRDYDGFKYEILKKIKDKIPEYTDFSDNDPGVAIVEGIAYCLDILSYYNDRVGNEVFLDTAKDTESIIKIANLFGYEIQGRTPARFKQVFEITPQENEITILKGTRITTNEPNEEERLTFEVEKDLVIPKGNTGLEKDTDGNYLYQTDITNAITVEGKVIGTSNGGKYQEFELPDNNIIEDTIDIYVNEGKGYEKWEKVKNFINSGIYSKHYRIKFDGVKFRVIFGNGALGKIPSNVPNGIIADYKVGGGKTGNVGANTITELSQAPSYIKTTFNYDEAFELGQDVESLEEIRRNITSNFKTLERAVTLKDFEDVAYKIPYVKSVKAIKNALDINAVDIYILIEGVEVIPNELLVEIANFYDNVRLLGVNITVNSPTFINIDLPITLWLFDNYRQSKIQELVQNLIEVKFNIGNWTFGKEYVKSELINEIKNIEGVKAINIDSLEFITPNENEILKLGNLTFDMRGGIVE